jgi:hypothetical protein
MTASEPELVRNSRCLRHSSAERTLSGARGLDPWRGGLCSSARQIPGRVRHRLGLADPQPRGVGAERWPDDIEQPTGQGFPTSSRARSRLVLAWRFRL